MAKIIKIDLIQSPRSEKDIHFIKEVLDLGGIIGFPTDTYYGLGANPLNEEAVQTIFKIKNRPGNKPFIILVDSVITLTDFVSHIDQNTQKLMDEFWPGPLTILFRVNPLLPAKLTAHTGKIGARIPGNVITRHLLEKIGHPLTGTSANISGDENLSTAQDVNHALGPQISAIVDGGKCPGEKESTVIDPTVSPPVIIREGAISREQIEAVLETKCA